MGKKQLELATFCFVGLSLSVYAFAVIVVFNRNNNINYLRYVRWVKNNNNISNNNNSSWCRQESLGCCIFSYPSPFRLLRTWAERLQPGRPEAARLNSKAEEVPRRVRNKTADHREAHYRLRIWWHGDPEVEGAVAEWCQRDPVYLPFWANSNVLNFSKKTLFLVHFCCCCCACNELR